MNHKTAQHDSKLAANRCKTLRAVGQKLISTGDYIVTTGVYIISTGDYIISTADRLLYSHTTTFISAFSLFMFGFL